MNLVKISSGLCVAMALTASLNAQYNENAGKNVAYEEVEVKEAVLTDDGDYSLDVDGEVIYESRVELREVSSDKHGNAEGNGYDLAQDGAFSGNTIAVINLCGNTMSYAKKAVAEKGINMVEWRMTAPPADELREFLEEASQLWVLSGAHLSLTEDHLDVIEEFFESGKGLYIWGDNDPYYADANFITQRLFGTTMNGDTYADQVVGISGETEEGFAGVVDGHLISTGVANIYEGITVATVKATQELSPLIYGSADNLVAAVYERDGKRAIIDGGFTRLCVSWDKAGTARYIKNAAAWLVNYERFGDEVYNEEHSEKDSKEKDAKKDLGLMQTEQLELDIDFNMEMIKN